MIIVKIFQGPGNQLFQYAYGLAASKRIGTDLKLDLSWFKDNAVHRPFVLDRFNIRTLAASQEDIRHVRTCDAKGFVRYRLNLLRNSLAPRYRKVMVRENLSKYDNELKSPYRNSFIEGYFSSELFFEDHAQEVRESFRFMGDLSEDARPYADSILAGNAVALSIRRGDFLLDPLHNICSTGYFGRAVRMMSEALPELELFIFSDDPEWVSRNMGFNAHHTLVTGVGDSIEQLRLMSLCKHHIIPNSTFSWWGAWLSGSENVIAPEFWLSTDRNDHVKALGSWIETSHTVPERWQRIPNRLDGESMMR